MEIAAIKNRKKVLNGWAFYDWANSVYPLVISNAIFPVFYDSVTSTKNEAGEVISDQVTFFGKTFINSELYSYVIAASFLIVIVLSPILSGVADYIGGKKGFLKFFCYLGALASASLYFFNPEHLELSMISIFLASIGFWGSLVFYNAYLPEIAYPHEHDKLSAKGFSLGYIGSALLLIVCLVMILVFEIPTKYCFLLVGIWWIGFSQITYASLPKNIHNRARKGGNYIKKGFQELRNVWNVVKRTKRLKRYLLAFFVFSMGIQTIMLMAVLFAKKEVEGMPDSGLIISILLIQFVAVAGSYLFSWSSSKIGNIKTLGVGLIIWIMICWVAYFIKTPIQFYFLAAATGLVMGGTQALSRSTYSKYLPPTKDTASFFSFYDITEKVGIVIGMFVFGYLEGTSGNMRMSVVALFIFFLIGLFLLMWIPKNETKLEVDADQILKEDL